MVKNFTCKRLIKKNKKDLHAAVDTNMGKIHTFQKFLFLNDLFPSLNKIELT